MNDITIVYDLDSGVIWGAAHSHEHATNEAMRWAPKEIHPQLAVAWCSEALFEVLESLGGDVVWFLHKDGKGYANHEKKAKAGVGLWKNPEAMFQGTEGGIFDVMQEGVDSPPPRVTKKTKRK